MKIAIWNVNSLKARKDHVLRFMADEAPDILMVQELKALEIPVSDFEKAGYKTHFAGQKAYNGVATFSRKELQLVRDSLPGFDEDEQARYIETADQDGHVYINIYAPNGNPTPGEKFDYKLSWLDHLYTHLKSLREQSVPFLIGGDFNIIPEPEDAADPAGWEGDALFRPESRAMWRSLKHLGLYDAFRIFNKGGGHYSFWDYQAGAWQKNDGIRIDHFLLSPALADHAQSCRIMKDPRGWEKPSDHTPVILELSEL